MREAREVLSPDEGQRLWTRIEDRLEASPLNWRHSIDHLGQVAAVERREQGRSWSDDDVFEALLRAVLSAATDWSKVERVIPELQDLFEGFSLERYAGASEQAIETRFVPWFTDRKAGSQNLRRNLIALADTARKLVRWSQSHASAEGYFTAVMTSVGADPKRAAMAIGTSGRHKLRGFGVPIAAEALRNLGFDLAKPDRHVCRATGAFSLVGFNSWPDRSGTKAPVATESERLSVMTVMEHLARLLKMRISFLDNAVWLLCAKAPSGLHLSNAELEGLALSRKHAV